MPPDARAPAGARARSPFTVLLAVGGVWLVATIVFSCLNMLGFHASHAWLAFIYAIPASFLMTEVFAIHWKLPVTEALPPVRAESATVSP